MFDYKYYLKSVLVGWENAWAAVKAVSYSLFFCVKCFICMQASCIYWYTDLTCMFKRWDNCASVNLLIDRLLSFEVICGILLMETSRVPSFICLFVNVIQSSKNDSKNISLINCSAKTNHKRRILKNIYVHANPNPNHGQTKDQESCIHYSLGGSELCSFIIEVIRNWVQMTWMQVSIYITIHLILSLSYFFFLFKL